MSSSSSNPDRRRLSLGRGLLIIVKEIGLPSVALTSFFFPWFGLYCTRRFRAEKEPLRRRHSAISLDLKDDNSSHRSRRRLRFDSLALVEII